MVSFNLAMAEQRAAASSASAKSIVTSAPVRRSTFCTSLTTSSFHRHVFHSISTQRPGEIQSLVLTSSPVAFNRIDLAFRIPRWPSLPPERRLTILRSNSNKAFPDHWPSTGHRSSFEERLHPEPTWWFARPARRTRRNSRRRQHRCCCGRAVLSYAFVSIGVMDPRRTRVERHTARAPVGRLGVRASVPMETMVSA
jgi:hypothetical protein